MHRRLYMALILLLAHCSSGNNAAPPPAEDSRPHPIDYGARPAPHLAPLIHEAETSFARGDLDHAINTARHLRDRIAAAPESASTNLAGGLALLEDAEWRVRTLTRVATLEPDQQRAVCEAESLRAPIRNHRTQGNFDAAYALAQRQRQVRTQWLEPGDPRTAYASYWCGIFHADEDSAEAYFRTSIDEFDRAFLHVNMSQARVRCHLARRLRDTERHQEAYDLFHDALTLATTVIPTDDAEVAWYHHFLARAAMTLGKSEEAERLSISGHLMAMRSGSKDAGLLNRGWQQAASILIGRGRYYDAERILAAWEQAIDPELDPFGLVQTVRYRGKLQRARRKHDDALASYRKGLRLAEQRMSEDRRLRVERKGLLQELALLYADLGDFASARTAAVASRATPELNTRQQPEHETIRSRESYYAAELADANRDYQASIAVREEKLDELASQDRLDSTYAATTMRALALAHEALGNADEALRYLEMLTRTWDVMTRGFPRGRDRSNMSAAPHAYLAALYLRAGRLAKAWNTLEAHRGAAVESLIDLRRRTQSMPWVSSRQQRALEAQLLDSVRVTGPKESAPMGTEKGKVLSDLWQSMAVRAEHAASSSSDPMPSSNVSIEAVQQELPSDAACLGWLDVFMARTLRALDLRRHARHPRLGAHRTRPRDGECASLRVSLRVDTNLA